MVSSLRSTLTTLAVSDDDDENNNSDSRDAHYMARVDVVHRCVCVCVYLTWLPL